MLKIAWYKSIIVKLHPVVLSIQTEQGSLVSVYVT